MGFGFEDLEVWKKSIDFANQVISVIEDVKSPRKHYRLLEQLESSSTSIPMNIAEGKGRFSKKEFIQFLYISRGSLYETMTLLIIFRMRNWISMETFSTLEAQAKEIVNMLMGLVKYLKKSTFDH
ncbi:MAG: four helix bundle protein [Proteobacteria bacterium]|nr:four helix bundle protein [Pseudomonadota bacterium]